MFGKGIGHPLMGPADVFSGVILSIKIPQRIAAEGRTYDEKGI